MNELCGWFVVNAATVQRGDSVNLDGLHRTVVDMFQLPRNGKHLLFEDGGTYHLRESHTLYAYRTPD